MIDKSKLKELALAATQGRWICGVDTVLAGAFLVAEVKAYFPENEAIQTANRDWIAAANPAAILELLAELESRGGEEAKAWLLWTADGSHVEINTNVPTVEVLRDDSGWRCAELPGTFSAEQISAITMSLAKACVARSLATTTSTEPAAPQIEASASPVPRAQGGNTCDDEHWNPDEQAAFSAWAINAFPRESSQGLISLGSAWKQGQAYASRAGSSSPADAGGLTRYRFDLDHHAGDGGREWSKGCLSPIVSDETLMVKFTDVCALLATKAAQPDNDPSEVEARIAQAKADLMPRREAFIKFLKARSLDEDEKVDAWGRREFKHSHIEAMWFGWYNALESGAATSASASPAAPGLDRLPWYCPHCQAGVPSKNVTFEEYHDPRAGGCGYRVGEWPAAPVAGSQQVPEGFAIVPKELTKAMREAYEKNSLAPVGPISTFGYVAMIAAAPAVPVPVEQRSAAEFLNAYAAAVQKAMDGDIQQIGQIATLHADLMAVERMRQFLGAAPSLQQPKEGSAS